MKLCLGTAQFGLDYGINNSQGKISEVDVSKILNFAHDNGIIMLDTASAYGNSELVLGEFIVKTGRNFKIISKYPANTGLRPLQWINISLNNLKINNLHGYLFHNYSIFQEHQDFIEDFVKIKQIGKSEKIGFSLYTTQELECLFSKNVGFDIVQFPYNILDKAFEPYFQELKHRNIEIHIRSVFLQGLFFKSVDELPMKLKPLKPYLIAMTEFCKKQNITMEELALNGVIHNPNIDGVLVGVDNLVQLQKNIKSVWTELPAKISEFIDTLDVKEKELLNPANWSY